MMLTDANSNANPDTNAPSPRAAIFPALLGFFRWPHSRVMLGNEVFSKFSALHVSPSSVRSFEEFEGRSAHKTAILHAEAWRERFHRITG